MPAAIPKVGFVSLGCPKATVDAERILTQLRAEGYLLTDDYHDANLVVVNTCGFIDKAVEESLDAIGEALAENGRVIVTGCLGAKEGVIQSAHPQVLAVTGPDALAEVMSAVHTHLPHQHDPYSDLVPTGAVKLTPPHYAYLKIAEGCNQSCSFCIIPSMRGKLVSRPIGEILDEAQHLVENGVRELLVVAQDTAAYGVDTKYKLDFWNGRPLKTRIHELVRELGAITPWLRLHYVYPYPHVDGLVELMAEGLALPYLDVPLQHASPRILKAMRRPADSENMLARIAKWRETCPDLTLRSSFIVGFPGETEEDFEALLRFVEQAGIDRVGAFAYSAVAGAPANALPGAVPESLKEERLERLLELTASLSADRLQARVGGKEVVIIDEVGDDELIARSAGEAPEVDGAIIIHTPDPLDVEPGDFIEVSITAADEFDLYADVELEDEDADLDEDEA